MDKTVIQQIVSEYRKAHGNGKPMTFQAMADALSDNVMLKKVSKQAVNNWEMGINEPDINVLVTIFVSTQVGDWRHVFVADLMAAKLPAVYAPLGEIGKRILGDPSSNQDKG